MFDNKWPARQSYRMAVGQAASFSTILLVLLMSCLLIACGDGQDTNQAGTATQDPPIPQLTQATHGIEDTTASVPQTLIEQLRTRSDTVETHGYQIAVVFFNDLASDPHQFATDVFNKNGIGYKDKNNGVLFVLYLQKEGKDGHAPWLSYITGGGISGALPDTLMDDYVQSTFVPARAQGHWQDGLLAFYDKVFTAEQDPNVAREWQTQHPQQPAGTSSTTSSSDNSNSSDTTLGYIILICIGLFLWLGISALVAIRRRQNFFVTAFRLLMQFFVFLSMFSNNSSGRRGSSRGGQSWGGGSDRGPWGGGGSSSSSGGDV